MELQIIAVHLVADVSQNKAVLRTEYEHANCEVQKCAGRYESLQMPHH